MARSPLYMKIRTMGREEGREEGQIEKARELATRMCGEGIASEQIQRITDLSSETLAALGIFPARAAD